MALIHKQQKVENDQVSVKLPVYVIGLLDAYAKHLDSDKSHVVCESLKYVIEKDREFMETYQAQKPVKVGKQRGRKRQEVAA